MSMSVGMLQGLNALVSLNSQIADLQQQGATGKKINNASDGLAAYLSSQGFTNRAERLQNVNDTLGTNLQTIKAAQTGLSSIRKTITDTLDTLKAASQTAAAAAGSQSVTTEFAVNDAAGPNSNSTTQFTMTFRSYDQTGVAQNNKLNDTTALVNPTGTTGSYLMLGGVKLEAGQVFKITGAGGTTYLKIGTAAGGQGTRGGSDCCNEYWWFDFGYQQRCHWWYK